MVAGYSGSYLSTTVNITPTNDTPVLLHTLIDQTATAATAFSFTVPAQTFCDPDGDVLTYSLAMADGTGIPPWIVFDSASGTLTGTPDNLDVGSFNLRLSARDASGATVSDTLLITVTATYVNDAPTGSVTISGSASQGQTLTASNTLADADGMGTVSYQWKAGGTDITNATSSTYTLTQAEVGKTITVTASYTDGQGTPESVASSATAIVQNVNDAPTLATPAAVSYTDTRADDTFTNRSGTLVGSDIDGDKLTYGIQGG